MELSVVNLCRRLRSIAKLFRFVELLIALALLTWLSTRLPFAVRISGEYFRRFSVLLLSPISIFLLGNAIVLTLLTKSGLFSGDVSSSIDIAVADFYSDLRSENHDYTIPPLEEEVVFQDKEIICEENSKIVNSKDHHQVVDDDCRDVEKEVEVKPSYRRSQSENLTKNCCNEMIEKNNLKLRRSDTDIRREEITGEESTLPEEITEDHLSNEEFQRTIEEFIAKQIRFHRQERLSVVLHGQA